MHLEQYTGPVPGLVYATVREGMTTRTFPIEIRRTQSGHYIARMPDDKWSIECRTVEGALLMHAAVLFPVEHAHAPWLSNPRPAVRPLDSFLGKSVPTAASPAGPPAPEAEKAAVSRAKEPDAELRLALRE